MECHRAELVEYTNVFCRNARVCLLTGVEGSTVTPLGVPNFTSPLSSEILLCTSPYLHWVRFRVKHDCCYPHLRDVEKLISRNSVKANLQKYSQSLSFPRTFSKPRVELQSVGPISAFSTWKCVVPRSITTDYSTATALLDEAPLQPQAKLQPHSSARTASNFPQETNSVWNRKNFFEKEL